MDIHSHPWPPIPVPGVLGGVQLALGAVLPAPGSAQGRGAGLRSLGGAPAVSRCGLR